jgi:hypothetical protein
MFDRPAAIRARLKAPVLLAFAIGLTWCAVEALVYRSGAYYAIAEPDSNTGAVVTKLHVVENQYRPDARNILVFGDSRVGEGFSSPRAAGDDDSINFINVAVPGSTPRTWYYLLREIERRGFRYEAVVVGTLYRDPTSGLRANWSLDPAHAAALLGLADARTFPASFESAPMRERARHAVLFPALAMRQDTVALLQDPRQRRDKIREGRPGFLAAVRNYPGRSETMPALRFADDGRSVVDWGEATPLQRERVTGHLAELAPRPGPITAANDAFLGRWLGAMAELARSHDALFVVYPLPRGPYRDALGDEPALPPSLQALAQTPGVAVLPPDQLATLEAPEYFFDTLHANSAGREFTGDTIGAAVRALLRTPAQ